MSGKHVVNNTKRRGRRRRPRQTQGKAKTTKKEGTEIRAKTMSSAYSFFFGSSMLDAIFSSKGSGLARFRVRGDGCGQGEQHKIKTRYDRKRQGKRRRRRRMGRRREQKTKQLNFQTLQELSTSAPILVRVKFRSTTDCLTDSDIEEMENHIPRTGKSLMEGKKIQIERSCVLICVVLFFTIFMFQLTH